MSARHRDASPQRSSGAGRIGGRRALAILALLPPLGLLLVAEVGLRWRRASALSRVVAADPNWRGSVAIHRRSRDPRLVYELVPGAEAEREGVRIRINAAGFRDDEFPAGLPERRRRIVLLGDSVAWGYGVPMHRAFPQLLERRLGEEVAAGEDPPLVYNLAVDGYSTAQEIRLLETRGLALRPHLIVLSYVLNDPDTSDGGLAHYYERRIELVRAVRHAAWRLRRLLAPGSEPAAGAILRALRNNPWTRTELREYHRFIHAYYADEIRAQFAQLGRIRRDAGVPILVALSPIFEFGPGQPYRWGDLHQSIGGLCDRNGLAYLDLYERFRGLPARRFALDGWHPNERGHAAIAKTLAEAVQALGWGPAATAPGP